MPVCCLPASCEPCRIRWILPWLTALTYRFLTRRAAEGSTPLTSAFQLGLYRDGSVLNLMDKREVELRRRAWAMVYHLDRYVECRRKELVC